MRKRALWCAAICIVLAGVSVAVAHAETTFKWGGAERIRYEYWRNWLDYNNDALDTRSFFRIKSSLWGQANVNEDVILYSKLTNEFKAYTYFGGTTTDKRISKKGYHFDINEIVFDNLYADVKNVLDAPVDVRVGRQDFLGTYGEGFLIMDGTPQDGSRTFYFNAAKVTWRADDNNTFDCIYVNDPRDEEFLPIINPVRLVRYTDQTLDKAPQALNTTDEQAGILYWKNKTIKDLALEGYYIFKTEAEEGGAGMQSQEGALSTFGAFAKYALAPFALRGQYAYQTGSYGENGREGFGGYGFLDYLPKDKAWSPTASLGCIYLSGDDINTTANEAWDPLFSRWPWMSDLYVMSMAAETGVLGYWTNLRMFRSELTFKPLEKVKVSLWYNYLWSDQKTAASAILSGSSKKRGHLTQAKVEYAVNKNVSTYVLAEYLAPGPFYVDTRDAGVFLRAELQIKF